MSLHDDRLQKARRLISLDPRRPQQVNLRGAITDAYYALFYLLIDAAVGNAVGRAPATVRQAMARWYDHRTMKEVASAFRGTPASAVRDVARALLHDASGRSLLPSALVNVADVFVKLQEQRHLADYDPSPRYTRVVALGLVLQAEKAFADWRSVSTDPMARLFLTLLLTGFKVIPSR